MFPIKDNIPGKSRPGMTILLITANILVFAFQSYMPPEIERRFTAFFGFVPELMSRSITDGNFVQYAFRASLTSMFLHGSLMHLISNMWILWIFGNNVEDTLGHIKYMIFYLSSGVFAMMLHYIFNISSQIPVIGASGAIAGVMGAYFVLFPNAKIRTVFIPVFIIPLFLNIPAVIYLGLWFIMQLYNGAFNPAGSVAWWAHVGGFVGGVILLKFLGKSSKRYRN